MTQSELSTQEAQELEELIEGLHSEKADYEYYDEEQSTKSKRIGCVTLIVVAVLTFILCRTFSLSVFVSAVIAVPLGLLGNGVVALLFGPPGFMFRHQQHEARRLQLAVRVFDRFPNHPPVVAYLKLRHIQANNQSPDSGRGVEYECLRRQIERFHDPKEDNKRYDVETVRRNLNENGWPC